MEESKQTYSHMGQTYTYTKKTTDKRTLFCIVGIVFVVLVAAVFSNPSTTKHKNEFSEVASSALRISIEKIVPDDASEIETGVALLLANTLTPTISDLYSSTKLSYHNLFFASYTTTQLDGQQICTTVGLFGKVFTISDEKLAEQFSNIIAK